MKQGEVAELKTGKMSSDGSCIARTPDGLVVFVTGALPGELVRARVVIRKKEYAVARLEEVITAASGKEAGPVPCFRQMRRLSAAACRLRSSARNETVCRAGRLRENLPSALSHNRYLQAESR